MTSQSISIERVLPDQLNTLQDLSKRTFADTFASDNEPDNLQQFLETQYSRERLGLELSSTECAFFFAMHDETVCGYTKINEGAAQTEQHGPGYIELERIYVSRKAQGLGIGKQLLDHAIEYAQRRGYQYLWLGVWENNVSAIAFYKKRGFTVFGEHIFHVGNDPQTDLLMRLDLANNPPA